MAIGQPCIHIAWCNKEMYDNNMLLLARYLCIIIGGAWSVWLGEFGSHLGATLIGRWASSGVWGYTTLDEMVAYFIENIGIWLENMTIQANWWNVINSKKDVKCARFVIVNDLLTYWQSMLQFCDITIILHKNVSIHYKWRFWQHQGCWGGGGRF